MKPHRLYNIGNHRSEHLMKVIGLLEEATGIRATIDFQPMQAGDVPQTYADISAISADLGYAPTTAIEVGGAAVCRVVSARITGFSWFRAETAEEAGTAKIERMAAKPP